MCGPYGTDCSYEEFFNYMGDMANLQTPFTVNYRFLDAKTDNDSYFDYKAAGCSAVAQVFVPNREIQK
jgi:hypothetical protein